MHVECHSVFTSPFTLSSHHYSVIKILALLPSQGFSDATCLKWSQSQDLLLQEILNSGADIITLEEVDHYHDFFLPALPSAGFTGQFLAKPSSPCLESKPNNGPDGCALFYRSSVFKLLDKTELKLVMQTREPR